jgi:wobble nucleotide-excising tRNase
VRDKRRLLNEESASLEHAIRQQRVPADELNAELRSYLGRDELKFMLEGAGYLIDRGGVRATDLSEGEKTAIAFLYFLKSLSGINFDLATGVVVIDDPVSSLDANSLFCSFAYLSKRTLNAGQLIILTHNFLFLKQVKNWFEYLPKGQVRHYMVESYMEPNGRAARISKMDKMLRDHQSEYHYLYHRVVQGSRIDQGLPLETYYGHPNMARRLLEIFLGFRFPAKQGFQKRIDSLHADPVVIARIRRFVHTYSHEEGDGEDIDATMLAESPVILTSILEAIRLEDPRHYDEMQALVVAAEMP